MLEEFAFADNTGDLLAEYRQTKTAFPLFILTVLLPFFIFSVLAVFAWIDWCRTEVWDMNPLGWLIMTHSVLCFLFWLLLRRLVAFREIRLYENGLRLTSRFRDLWIPWETVERIIHDHTIFYIKILPLKYNLLKIHVAGYRVDIESGTGFAFVSWEDLFSEIVEHASNAEFKENKDWMAF